MSYVKSKPAAPEEPKKLNVPRAGQGRKRTPPASPDRTSARDGLSPTGQFLKKRELLPDTTEPSLTGSREHEQGWMICTAVTAVLI